MHSAPAVSYPVGRSYFYLALLVGVLAMGACSLIAWGIVSDALGLRHLAAMLLWLTAVGVALLSWLRTPTGVITWDGQNWIWTCQDSALPVALCVTMDLQIVMLMRLQSSVAPSHWVWLERRVVPGRWLACRRAVFGRQPPDRARDADLVAP
jgi:hypothetical protein